MGRRKISDIAIEVMKENGLKLIGYSNPSALGEIFRRAKAEGICKDAGSRGGRGRPHPMNRITTVLNALDRDSRFKKGYMKCVSCRANGESHVRIFELKEGDG